MAGDINDDTKVDVLDVQLVVNVFLGSNLVPVTMSRADVLCVPDNSVNILDYLFVVNAFLSGQGAVPPSSWYRGFPPDVEGEDAVQVASQQFWAGPVAPA